MPHNKKLRKFARKGAHRSAMLMNLVKSLIRHSRLTTTLAKAKSLRQVAEKIITKGRTDTLHNKRQIISFFGGICPEVNMLFSEVANKVGQRNGGYLRIIKIGPRQGDNAPMAIIEFVDSSSEIA